MPRPFAAFGQRLEDGFVGDGDELPGLGVLGGLGATASVEDGKRDFLG